MYPFIKVKSEVQRKIFWFFVISLVVLTYMWYALTAIQDRINCQIVVVNTNKIINDNRFFKVEHIDREDTLYLEDTTKVNDSEVKEYASIKSGSGTYYMKGKGVMGRELTKSEELDLVLKSIVLYIVACIACLLLMFNTCSAEYAFLKCLLYMSYLIGLFILSDLSIGYYSRNILGREVYHFAGCGVVFVAYIAYVISIVRRQRSERTKCR